MNIISISKQKRKDLPMNIIPISKQRRKDLPMNIIVYKNRGERIFQ
jgi:hypothetical protein